MPIARQQKKKKAEEGAPAWMVTYGDMMTLLLCFFVILVSMSELKQDAKFKKVLESIRIAFGYDGGIGRMPTDQEPKLSIIKQMLLIQIPQEILEIGDTRDPGIEGRHFRITEVREGLKIAFGGALQFERFSDQLLTGREMILVEFAKRVKGLNNIIEILGHTTLEEIPQESRFESKDDLAMSRASRVRDILVELGIKPKRMRLMSVADHEPLVRQSYTEEKRARNRRVEIIVSEALMSEFEGEELSVEERLNYAR